MNQPYLRIEQLSKMFPTPKGPFVVLENFNLEVMKGEFVAIIGHSGCGKSTVLSMVAGLNDVTSGTIFLNAKPVSGPGPDRGVVFQAPSLFPWMTALENVMLGVNRVYPHGTKRQREDIGKYYLSKVGLGASFHQRASEMSNGMRQRVGIARAFALKPKLLLLDEPFGMLDSLTRGELQEVLMEIWSREKVTAILVTHDVDEALFLSDRTVMMTSGPKATVGDILRVDFPRPRLRPDVLAHPKYYDYRGYLMDFLEGNHQQSETSSKIKAQESELPVVEQQITELRVVEVELSGT